jgi:hypothetical protein
VLLDDTTYKVSVQVWDAPGVSSTVATRIFDVDYLAPMVPQIIVNDFVPAGGSVGLAILNPTPTGGEPDVVYNELYRSVDGGAYELIVGSLDPNSTTTDTVPVIGQSVQYRAVAVSTTPSSAEVIAASAIYSSGGLIYINAGPGFGDVIQMQYGTSIKQATSTPQEAEQFAGRDYPVLYEGEAHKEIIDVTATFFDLDYVTEINRVLGLSGPKYFRDPFGRAFACALLSGYNITHTDNLSYVFTATLTRIDE